MIVHFNSANQNNEQEEQTILEFINDFYQGRN